MKLLLRFFIKRPSPTAAGFLLRCTVFDGTHIYEYVISGNTLVSVLDGEWADNRLSKNFLVILLHEAVSIWYTVFLCSA